MPRIEKDDSQFIYKTEDDTYTIQTKDLMLLVSFRSPIKQISDFFEQYEKYALKAALSSVNIKAFEYSMIYKYVKETVNHDFQCLMQKTMEFIEDLIMNVHFMKVQTFHYYAKTIEGFKTHLLQKDLDCYDFNLKQFEGDFNKAVQYLKQYKAIKDPVKVKEELRKKTEKIQKVEDEKLKNMFVKNPFRPQNQHQKEVNASSLFFTYLRQLEYKTDYIKESFQLKHFQFHENILKFHDCSLNLSLKNQRLALHILNEYNEKTCHQFPNTITPIKYQVTERQFVDANDINLEWTVREVRPSALINRKEKVSFTNAVMMHDEETKQDQVLTCTFFDPKRIYVPDEDHFTNAQYSSYYLEHYEGYNPFENMYNRVRVREHPLGMEQSMRHLYAQKYHEALIELREKLDVKSRRRKEIKFSRMSDEQSHFASVLVERKEAEKKMWKLKMKGEARTMYQIPFQTKEEKYYKKMPHNLNQADQKKFDENVKSKLKKEEEIRKEKSTKYEQIRQSEEEWNLTRNRKILQEKTYKKFAQLMGLSNFFSEIQEEGEKIYRYEKVVHKNANKNENYKDVEEFLSFYLKERVYRQRQDILEKSKIPILYNVKTAEQFINPKTISIILKQTEKFPFFIIWGSEIIIYKERSLKKTIEGEFVIYAYSNVKNSQILFFELKRRANFLITGKVIDSYSSDDNEQKDLLKKAYSKLEVIHRELYNFHMKTKDLGESSMKGKEIYSKIIKSIEDELKSLEE